jgi:hypothetical protein
MKFEQISDAEFDLKSHAKSQHAFNQDFEKECVDAINQNKGNCLKLSLKDAFAKYEGKNVKDTPTKIVGSFFLSQLKKLGYKTTKGRVSINNDEVRLKLK